MSQLLYRLGHFAVRRRRHVLAVWLVILVATLGLAGNFGGETNNEWNVPGTEAQQASDLRAERFPDQSGSTARVVFSTDGSLLTEPDNQAAVSATLDAMAAGPGVVRVDDPFTAGTISADGTIAFADVHYAVEATSVPTEDIEAMRELALSSPTDGIAVSFGGEVAVPEEIGHTAEMIGIGVAALVLLVSFGSVVAMGLPVVTALIGVGIGMMGIRLLAGVTDVSSTAPTLAMMIGLAVGIDYALFIVTRHRQNLADGHSVAESAARANATAGGAVVFAGATVVIALAGLVIADVPLLTIMGLTASFTVLIAVAIAVTLLPAMLGFAGHGIDRWRVGRTRTGSAEESQTSMSARWARGVMKRPGAALAAGTAVMLILAIPALDMRLGLPGDGAAPEGSTRRTAYDLLADGFGPGFNGPLVAVVDLTNAADSTIATADVTAAIASDSGVLSVRPAVLNPANDTAIIPFIPSTGPASEETEQLVHRLRADVFTMVEADTGADISLTGQTAVRIDLADKMAEALPTFVLVVIGLTTALLLMVFRSLVIPIKAAIAILLSIASSFGVVVAVFQWGWLGDLIGVDGNLPILPILPILMFAILFGLSMDYEVFIVSRIREDWVRTGRARESVLTGLTSSARVITAAALIMISVFASFIFGDDPSIKMFGVGFSVAVLLDATIVRMMIVPAVLALFDKRTWWMPTWLDRLLPDLDIEGQHLIDVLDDEDRPEQLASDEAGELVGIAG